MSVGHVIKVFSTFTKLPVYAEDVAGQLVDMGVQDHIHFQPLDIPPESLLGFFLRYRDRALYGPDHKNCSAVFYNSNVEPDFQNYICIKELMHVFDSRIEGASTSTKEDLQALLDHLFHDPATPLELNPGGMLDEMALAMAVAVMVPEEARDQFIRAIALGKISRAQAAEACGLPEPVFALVTAKQWEGLRAILLKM